MRENFEQPVRYTDREDVVQPVVKLTCPVCRVNVTMPQEHSSLSVSCPVCRKEINKKPS